MFTFNVERHVPKFILADKNGYAMAKAIEAGVQALLNGVQEGVDCLTDSAKMPEWRLDELAWEYAIPYDYTANIESKRAWISAVHSISRLHGTPESIREYLAGYFDDAGVEEAADYGGDPFHFKVLMQGSWDEENFAWAVKAVEISKNVRSVLDGFEYNENWPYEPMYGAALYSKERAAYTVPAGETDYDILADGDGTMLTDEDGIVLVE